MEDFELGVIRVNILSASQRDEFDDFIYLFKGMPTPLEIFNAEM